MTNLYIVLNLLSFGRISIYPLNFSSKIFKLFKLFLIRNFNRSKEG